MSSFNGQVYSSGTITSNDDSGWFDVSPYLGETGVAMDKATILLVPANLATDETLNLDLNIAWTLAGGGDTKVHDFTEVTATNAVEMVILPGGESTNLLTAGTDLMGAALPPFWKFTWALVGTTKSMDFAIFLSAKW